MPTNTGTTVEIAHRIQELCKQRDFHADMLQAIDATLERIGGVLNGKRPGRRGRPPKSALSMLGMGMPAARGGGGGGAGAGGARGKGAGGGRGGRGRRRRRRGRFALSGDDSVLEFIRKRGKATTSDIQQ